MSDQTTEPTPIPAPFIPAEDFPVPTPEPTPEPTALPPEPVSVGGIIKVFIAAIVASINTHCHSAGATEAAVVVEDLKSKIGDELTPAQHAHLDKVFSVIQESPSPVSKVPAPPSDDVADPVPIPTAVTYPGINTGPAK